MKIYIAGQITNGATQAPSAKEIRLAEDIAFELITQGFEVYLPHAMSAMFSRHEMKYGIVMMHCLAWLRTCDAILRLPNESHGADLEVEMAERYEIPTFYSVKGLVQYATAK